MNIHIIQHVPFEGPGEIERYFASRGDSLSRSKLYRREAFPAHSDYDLLVIMGGPMGLDEEGKYPWLIEEKKFIESAMEAGKKILGICLGAQLIASVAGARVYKNRYREIGWFPVTLTSEGKEEPLFSRFPSPFTPFHWHGDTFDLPHGAVHVARSEACEHQAYVMEGRVIGLQFHLEMGEVEVNRILSHCGDEITEELYVQTAEEMKKQCATYVMPSVALLHTLLDRLAET